MPKPHKIAAEEFYGKVLFNVLASSKGGKKLLKVATFLYGDGSKSEIIFQVTYKLGSVQERTTGYDTLEEAISIYNMAEA